MGAQTILSYLNDTNSRNLNEERVTQQ